MIERRDKSAHLRRMRAVEMVLENPNVMCKQIAFDLDISFAHGVLLKSQALDLIYLIRNATPKPPARGPQREVPAEPNAGKVTAPPIVAHNNYTIPTFRNLK